MTLASVVSAFTRLKVDALLAIDGIPVLFGTREGRVWSTSGTDPVSEHPSSWTSVAAIVPESIQMGARELDKDASMVRPSSVTLSIAASSAWDKYFERRRAPQGVYLTSDATVSVTSLTVNNTASFVDGDYAYLGRETIKINTVFSATSLSSVSRNQIAIGQTRPAYHRQTNAGSKLTLTPQYHTGRPAVLRLVVGDSDADFSDTITMVMSDSPRYNKNNGTWELSFSDGMEQFDRKIAVGLDGSTINDARINGDYVDFDIESNWDEFRTAQEEGQVWIVPPEDSDAPPLLVDIEAPAAAGLQTVQVSFHWFLNGHNAFDVVSTTQEGIGFSNYVGGTIRRCYTFKDYPVLAALKVLLSQVGDSTNDDATAYDVLWGRTSDSNASPVPNGETEKRFGAGIYKNVIDITGIEEYRDVRVDGWFYVLGARGEEDLLTFLEEVAWAVGGFWYFNGSGKLTLRRHTAAYTGQSSTFTVADTDTVREQAYVSVDDEKSVIHTVSVKCNYGPDRNEPSATVTAVYDDYKELYRNTAAATVVVERKGLIVQAPGQMFVSWVGSEAPSMPEFRIIQPKLHRMMVLRNVTTRTYTMVLPWKYVAVMPGDRISLTHGLFNAFDGTTTSSLVCEVEHVAPDYNGQTVTVTCRETLSGKWLSPVGRLTGAAAGNTITLASSSTLWGGGTTPARYWAAGWAVTVLDASAAYAPLGTTTIDSIGSDTTIVLTAAPAGTAAGDLLVMREYDNSSSTTASASLGAGQRDHAFMADSAYTLGASLAEAHKWG